jgi:hypothetical protein
MLTAANLRGSGPASETELTDKEKLPMLPRMLAFGGDSSMKSLAIAAAVLFTVALPAAAQSLDGRYQVQGKNFDGTAYTGTAEIVSASKTPCHIVWHTAGDITKGICMRNGSTFAASYHSGKSIGLVIYDIKPDGSMDGRWTLEDTDGVGSESLTPQK